MKIFTSRALRLITLALLPFISHPASAYEFSADGIRYHVTTDKEVEVIYNDYYSTLTDMTIPSEVTDNGVAFTVTSIGEAAFYNCASLESIKIPESVTSIGDWAFQNCISLTGIEIPDGVTRLGEGVFYDCVSLTEIILPSTMNDVGENTFQNCPLRKVRHSFVPR